MRALWSLVLVLGCAKDPPAALEELHAAIERGEVDEIARNLHPDYSDVLGTGTRVVADFEALRREYPRVDIETSDLEVLKGVSEQDIGDRVIGRLEMQLVGEPEWRFLGPLDVEYRPAHGRTAVRSGLLVHLRDIRELLAARRSALEANDAAAYVLLLHPEYRDGDLDRAEVEKRLSRDLAGVPVRLRPIHYRVDVRGEIAHVDERYTLTVRDREIPGQIARLTLKRSAGRWRIAGGLYPDEA